MGDRKTKVIKHRNKLKMNIICLTPGGAVYKYQHMFSPSFIIHIGVRAGLDCGDEISVDIRFKAR